MVEPTNRIRPARVGLTVVLALAVFDGCSVVPKAKLDECHRLSQTLRSENSRLKDVAMDLRAQNQDLSERAVDDSRKLAAYEETNERLEASVHGYQSERDKLAAAFEAVKRQVQATASPDGSTSSSVSPSTRLKAFAEAHPAWTLEKDGLTLSSPPDRLFEKGVDALKPDAVEGLKTLAAALSGKDGEALTVEVVGPATATPVVRAGYDAVKDHEKAVDLTPASGRFLGAARAAKIRDRLISDAHLDPSRVRLAPPSADPGDSLEIRFVVPAAKPPATTAVAK